MIDSTSRLRALFSISLLGMLFLAGCAASHRASPLAPTANVQPIGATIGASGFATILFAPSTGSVRNAPLTPPPPPVGEMAKPLPMTSEAMLAREAMMNPDEASTAKAQLLDQRIKASERGNYIGMRIVRDPAARFAFQFRRDAEGTLARYTRDPRFTYRQGGVPAEELQPVFDEWWKRFEPYRLVGAGSVDAFDGAVKFDVNVDEATFTEIAAQERWLLPERLQLRFSQPR